jgi:hypothetical protein
LSPTFFPATSIHISVRFLSFCCIQKGFSFFTIIKEKGSLDQPPGKIFLAAGWHRGRDKEMAAEADPCRRAGSHFPRDIIKFLRVYSRSPGMPKGQGFFCPARQKIAANTLCIARFFNAAGLKKTCPRGVQGDFE